MTILALTLSLGAIHSESNQRGDQETKKPRTGHNTCTGAQARSVIAPGKFVSVVVGTLIREQYSVPRVDAIPHSGMMPQCTKPPWTTHVADPDSGQPTH